MDQALDGAAVPVHIHQDWGSHLIPIPGAVPVILVVGFEVSCVCVLRRSRSWHRGYPRYEYRLSKGLGSLYPNKLD